MNTIGSDGTPVGGGEILNYVGNSNGTVSESLLNDRLINMFKAVPVVKIVIYILLIFLAIYFILKLFKLKINFKGKGVTAELSNIEKIKRRDSYILRANAILKMVVSFVNKTPFTLSKSTKSYMDYNIERAGLKTPGGLRDMTAVEFNAIIVVSTLIACALSLIVAIVYNIILGVVMIISIVVASGTLPMAVIRQKVKQKDQEIKDNFMSFYLMLHYVLVSDGGTPLSNIMRSYEKTTESVEMKRFIDNCINTIEVYGEYEATNYIASKYREIHEVSKLMRLIRQANEGGDIKQELLGFRKELLNNAYYAIEKRGDKLIAKANRSFNVLMIVLIQAILSALAIYLPDLGVAKSLFGL